MAKSSRANHRDVKDYRDLDAALIRALQENGRASIHELSQTLDASRDLVSQRVRRLVDEDGLKIVAAVDPGHAGRQVLIHAMVDIDGAARPVASKLSQFTDTVLVSMVSGPRPIVFESRHGNHEEMEMLLDEVRAIPSVRSIRITTYAEVIKGFFVAKTRKEISPDPIDFDIIAMLQQDGRTSYAVLSEAVHLSPSSVRERVAKLLDAGVIRISAIQPGGISRSRFSIGLGISARGNIDDIREHLRTTPNIDFAARTYGNHDFIATANSHVSSKVLEVIEDLRALPGVASLDSWTHLDLIKEEYARRVGQVLRP
ncbi:Lrp/AsnC family transcriptional regulator [Kocuria sp. TGY1127_2]|uniref:Lrp/AsnC family transcriptional regulator n=1 Tax=Kocuria sp. TGY1127_2 TaxID=2711328 RepID=UPI001FAE1ACD|nr:Lrp/AsnC family transcriptional regulator [Kocuria sp. TGY1127_2]